MLPEDYLIPARHQLSLPIELPLPHALGKLLLTRRLSQPAIAPLNLHNVNHYLDISSFGT